MTSSLALRAFYLAVNNPGSPIATGRLPSAAAAVLFSPACFTAFSNSTTCKKDHGPPGENTGGPC